jgi:PAP2 superfamily.
MAERVRRRAIVTAVACAVLLCVVHQLAVRTRAGQAFEDAVLDAHLATAAEPHARTAVRALRGVSVFSLAGAITAVFAIGMLRRRPALGVTSAGLIAAAVLATEIAKLLVVRPLLLESGVHREDQSFPSGHTAVAMSVMCGLALVSPYRMRVAAIFLGSLWAIGIAVATVTGNYHRPSDTLGAELITLICVCAAIVLLTGRGVRQASPDTGRAVRRLLATGYAVTAAAALAFAAVRQDVYTAGWAIALAGGCLTTLILLALLGTADLAGPAERPASGHRAAAGTGRDLPGRCTTVT